MNKKKYFIYGIGASCCFEILVFLVFLVIIGYREMVMDSVPAVTFILALVILMLYPTIWGINTLNRLYDGRPKGVLRKRSSQRWAMYTVFIGVVLFSILIMGLVVYDYIKSGLDSFANIIGVGVCFAVLVYASVIYYNNYFYLKPKFKRIKDLKKSSVLNGDRRYTFLVDEVISDNEYHGYVNGDMKVGDFVHLLDAGCEPGFAKIIKIESIEDSNKAKILIESNNNDSVGKYGVISSFKPCANCERVIYAENPRLVAMIKGYSEYAGDNDYASALVYDACNSKFIVPAIVPHHSDHRGEIMDAMDDDQEFSFLSVTANDMDGEPIIPVFTDWASLEEYKEVMNSEKAVSLLLSFPEIIRIMNKYIYSGIALNPFGPKPFYFSQEYIYHITSLDGYKESFVYNQED